jgi:hypothetical protein
MILPCPPSFIRRVRIETGFAMHVAIDDSDSLGSSDYVCLAALGGQNGDWEPFHLGWAELLRKHEIPFLHTADFLTGNGPYRLYGEKRAERRREIVGEFAQFIVDNVPYGYTIAIHKPPFVECVKELGKRINVQTMCFSRVIARIVDQYNQGLITEPITFCVDDSAKQAQQLLALWQDLRRNHAFSREITGCIAFCDDRYWSMVQAADLLANSAIQELRRGEDAFKGNSPLRVVSPADKVGKLIFESEVWMAADIEANRELIRDAHKRV